MFLTPLLAALPKLSDGGDPWAIPTDLERGPGFYLALWKIALVWMVILMWVRTSDWISRDALEHKLNHRLWNPLVVFSFVVSLVLLFVVPSFAIGLPLVLLGYLGPTLAYVFYRNARVHESETVLTPGHIRYKLATMLRPVGVKMHAEKPTPRDAAPPVEFITQGGASERDDRANLLAARQHPAFVKLQKLIVDADELHGEAMAVIVSPQATSIRVWVDAVWHELPAETLETGTGLLTVLRTLCGLSDDPNKKQSGRFTAKHLNQTLPTTLTLSATADARQATLRFDRPKKFETLTDIGVSESAQKLVEDVMSRNQGMVLFSSLPQQGLTTAINASLMSTDRYMREFYALEDADRRDVELENIEVLTFRAAAGESPLNVFPALLRKYPGAVVCRNLADGEVAKQLCQQVQEKRFVLTSLAAKDAVEALLRVLILKVDAALFARSIVGSIHVRLIRKLCPACKQAYEPGPEVLKPLGLSPEKISKLYRPTVGPQINPVRPKDPPIICKECGGIGYRGRTGLFEVLVVDDTVRQLLVSQPKLDVLRPAARKAGFRTAQEEGVRMVAAGVTSVDELVRILKS